MMGSQLEKCLSYDHFKFFTYEAEIMHMTIFYFRIQEPLSMSTEVEPYCAVEFINKLSYGTIYLKI